MRDIESIKISLCINKPVTQCFSEKILLLPHLLNKSGFETSLGTSTPQNHIGNEPVEQDKT